MKLIILDRDGVINHDRSDYVKSADECLPVEGSIEAIVRLHQAGFTVVVATNQSGLARGKFDLDDLEAIHHKLSRLCEEAGGAISAIFYCPHAPQDECKCRKPKAGLLDAIEAEFNTSLDGVVFVGDSLRDIQAGEVKGCLPVLVKTGKGAATLAALEASDEAADKALLARLKVFDHLAAAVDDLLDHSHGNNTCSTSAP